MAEGLAKKIAKAHKENTAFKQAFADFFLTWYGPTRSAAARLDEVGRQALRDEMVELAADSDRGTDGTFVSDWEYLLVTALRQS